MKTIVNVTYHDSPSHSRIQTSQPYNERYEVDIELYKNQLAREDLQLKVIVKELRSMQRLLSAGILVKSPQDIEKENKEYAARLQDANKSQE